MTTVAYRFHPETGEDANDVPTHDLTDAEKAELAEWVRAGARFYWIGAEGQWCRIERSNYAFVALVQGEAVEWRERLEECRQ